MGGSAREVEARVVTGSPAAVVLMPGDNVAIACRRIAPGESLTIAGVALLASDLVPLGHKLALRPIAPGGKVLRCGVPIGSATRAIAAGEHVHTQNLVSDYIPTFTLDGPFKFQESGR
jgi:altronate dehydratase small subunit